MPKVAFCQDDLCDSVTFKRAYLKRAFLKWAIAVIWQSAWKKLILRLGISKKISKI